MWYNFVLEMHKAVTQAERTIAVLSRDYLDARYTQPEWAAAFAQDPTGRNGLLLPVRVRPCEVSGILSPIVYIDLIELEEGKARDILLSAVRSRVHHIRGKPANRPTFPGVAQRSVLEQPSFPGGSRPVRWNIPQPRNFFFTGRQRTLDELRAELLSQGRAALSGFGGIGKTQIAIEYAYRYRADNRAVLWVRATSREVLIADFVALADLLGLPVAGLQEQETIITAVKEWLASQTGWLLILDNADRSELVKEFLPLENQGHILLTSRAQVFDQLGINRPIKPGEMASDEARHFLLKRTDRTKASSAEVAAAQELAEELGYLPLALEQAGAYIIRVPCSIVDYLSSYRRKGLQVLEKHGPITGDYPMSVATTWLLNFEQVEQTSVAAADLLRASAFFSSDKIPLELVRLGAQELGPAVAQALADVANDPLALDEALAPLAQYSLIRRDIDGESYDVHRLIQAVQKGQMDEAAQRRWAERCVRALNRAFPNVEELSAWALWERLLPHALVCAELAREWGLTLLETGFLCSRAGNYLHERGRYKEGAPLLQRGLTIVEQALGPHHSNVAISLNDLAELYYAQGKYAEAEPLFQRALKIREDALGPHQMLAPI
jgi:tetratricopeptide (TPR) repeat protein